MKSIISKTLLLTLIFVLAVGSFAFAGTDKIGDDVVKALKGGGKSVLGDGVQETIAGISMDIWNIVRYVVMAGLLIGFFLTLYKFKDAGDNPQLKAQLKGRLLWTGGGLILAINFWTIYNFLSNSINLGLK